MHLKMHIKLVLTLDYPHAELEGDRMPGEIDTQRGVGKKGNLAEFLPCDCKSRSAMSFGLYGYVQVNEG